MRNSFRAVLLFLAVEAANVAVAQQSVTFSLDGGATKIIANAFTWGIATQAPTAATGGAFNPTLQDSQLQLPIGDAAVLFAQDAMRVKVLPMVLVEFPLARAKPGGPAPFAARLSNVVVTSVTLSKSGTDGGPGVADVKLRASKVELFITNQAPDGSMRPGTKAGFDASTGKAL